VAVSWYTAEPWYKSDRCIFGILLSSNSLFHLLSLPFVHPPSSIPEIKNTPNDFYGKNKTKRMRERRKRKKEAETHIKKFF
jgi:hypothetical protein